LGLHLFERTQTFTERGFPLLPVPLLPGFQLLGGIGLVDDVPLGVLNGNVGLRFLDGLRLLTAP
jgi:hypothetical protein